MDHLARLQAIEIRHSEVQYHQVGPQHRSSLDCCKTILRFSTNFPPVPFNQISKGASRSRGVVGNKYAGHPMPLISRADRASLNA
jgi:hypothetical protein